MSKIVAIKSGEIVDAAAIEIGDLYERGTRFTDNVRCFIDAGEKLAGQKKLLGHGKWLPWLADNEGTLGFGERTSRCLIKIYNFSEKRQLTADIDHPTAIRMLRAIWGNETVRGTQGTGENEWYTPSRYVEMARETMGCIDIDPATSIVAQYNIKAKSFFTIEDDGLAKEWNGNVWLNPPYAQPAIQHFVEKLVGEVATRRTTQAIMLTHNYTDTEWFHIGARACSALCFTRGRIKFVSPEGEEAAPTQGQAFFYFGDRHNDFKKIFSTIGFVR
jgi:phage N-6-adenine-methyltransferase